MILETRDIVVVISRRSARRRTSRSAAQQLVAVFAAWLSHADRIFMAVTGLMNPMQYHLVDLLPFGDPRYRFYLIPDQLLRAAGASCGRASPASRRSGDWCRMRQLPRRMFQEAPRFDPLDREDAGGVRPGILPGNQCRRREDGVGADNLQGARQHYWQSGVPRASACRSTCRRPGYASRARSDRGLSGRPGRLQQFRPTITSRWGGDRGYRPVPDNLSQTWWGRGGEMNLGHRETPRDRRGCLGGGVAGAIGGRSGAPAEVSLGRELYQAAAAQGRLASFTPG